MNGETYEVDIPPEITKSEVFDPTKEHEVDFRSRVVTDAVRKLRQPIDRTVKDITDLLDPNTNPLDSRMAPEIPKLVRDFKRQNAAQQMGMGAPAAVESPGGGLRPLPTKPLSPASLAKGVIEEATFGLVDLPDAPDEAVGSRIVRGLGQMVGAAMPLGLAFKGARAAAGAWAVAPLAKRAIMAGYMGTYGLAEGEMRDIIRDEETSNTTRIIRTGLNAALGALAGPTTAVRKAKAMAEIEGVAPDENLRVLWDNVYNKPRPKQADIDKLQTAYEQFARKWYKREYFDFSGWRGRIPKVANVSEPDQEIAHAYSSFVNEMKPGEFDYSRLDSVLENFRKGNLDGNEMFFTAPELPRLAELSSTKPATRVRKPKLGKPPGQHFAAPSAGPIGKPEFPTYMRGGAPEKTLTEETVPDLLKSEGILPEDVSPEDLIKAGALRVSRVLGKKATTAKAAQGKTRASPELTEVPEGSYEEVNITEHFVPPKPGGPVPEGYIRTAAGDVITEEAALRMRGKPGQPKHLVRLGGKAKETRKGGVHTVSYYDAETGELSNQATYVRLVPTKGGLQVPGTQEVIGAEPSEADFLVTQIAHGPGLFDPLIFDLRRRGANYIKAATPGIRGGARRLGAEAVYGEKGSPEEILSFGNLAPEVRKSLQEQIKKIPVGGGAPQGPVKATAPQPPSPAYLRMAGRESRVRSDRPQEPVMQDIEMYFVDPNTGKSAIPAWTALFKPYERAKTVWIGEATKHDAPAYELIRKLPRAKRNLGMEYLTSTDEERAAAGLMDKLTSGERGILDSLKAKIYDPIMKEAYGIDSTRFFEEVLPRYRSANNPRPEVWQFFGNEVPDWPEVNMLSRGYARGTINPVDNDLARFTGQFIRGAYWDKYMSKPQAAALSFARADGMPKAIGDYLMNYIRGASGEQDWFVNAFGEVYRKMWRLVGHDVQPDEVRNVVTVWNNLIHAGLLGWNPGPIIRNDIGGFLTGAPLLGNKWYLAGRRFSTTAEGRALYQASGIAEMQATILDKIGDLAGGPITSASHAVARIAMLPYGKVDQWPRMNMYLGGYLKVKNAIKTVPGTASDAEFWSKAGLWRFHPVIKNEVTKLWRAGVSQGGTVGDQLFERAAKTLGMHAQMNSQWMYSQGYRPQMLNSEAGRAFGTFGVWPMNYLEYVRNMARAGHDWGVPPDEQRRWIAMWALNNLAVVGAFGTAGYAVGLGPEALRHTLGWTFLGPLSYTGGPMLDFIDAMFRFAGEAGSLEFGQGARELRRAGENLVPGFNSIRAARKSSGNKPWLWQGKLQGTPPARSGLEWAFRWGTGVQPKR